MFVRIFFSFELFLQCITRNRHSKSQICKFFFIPVCGMTTMYVTSQDGHRVWVFVCVLSCAHFISRVRDMSHIVLYPAWLSSNSIMMYISHFPFLSPSLPLPLSPCKLFSHITTHNVSTKLSLTSTVAITPSSAWLHMKPASVFYKKSHFKTSLEFARKVECNCLIKGLGRMMRVKSSQQS